MAGPIKLFPIQLRRIGIGEIAFQCPSFGRPGVVLSEKVDLSSGVGPYDSNIKALQVFLTASCSSQEPGIPFTLKITVVGEYYVPDEAALPFPKEKLPHWAEHNGTAVLLPFLRELVYTITQKTGFSPILLPLIEVMPYKVAPPDVTCAPLSAGPAEPVKI